MSENHYPLTIVRFPENPTTTIIKAVRHDEAIVAVDEEGTIFCNVESPPDVPFCREAWLFQYSMFICLVKLRLLPDETLALFIEDLEKLGIVITDEQRANVMELKS